MGGDGALSMAGPAISMWTQGQSLSIKHSRKAAAVEAPPYLLFPLLQIFADSGLISSQ